MPVAKPTDVPRWADGGTNTPTNVVDPPEHNGSIAAWAPGPYTVATFVGRAGNYYIVTGIAGTGTSTTGPAGTGTTIDNPGANQVVWGFVTTTPVTKDSGWLPGIQPPAQFFNWIFFLIYQWILWIQDLANQNFTGGGGVGPWTGLHIFTGGVGTTAPITVEAGISTSGGQVPGIDSTGSPHPGGNAGTGLIGRGGPSAGGFGGNGVEGYNTGTGSALYGQALGTGNALTLFGVAGGFAAEIAGAGTLAAVKITCTASTGAQGIDVSGDGNGGTATGGAGSAVGWIGISQGSGPGLAGASFGTGAGVQGVASTGAAGILGQSATSQPAGQFDNTTAHDGLSCSSQGGVACRINSNGAGGEGINVFSQGSSLPAVAIANAGTGIALDATSVNSSASVTVENTGSGKAISATSNASTAIQGQGGSTGPGVLGTGGSGGGIGVSGVGGGSAGPGVSGIGTATGAGVNGFNFAGGPGIEASNARIKLFGANGFIETRQGDGPAPNPAANNSINPWEQDTWTIPALHGNTGWDLASPPGGITGFTFKVRQQGFPPAQLHNLAITFSGGALTLATFAPGPGTGNTAACVVWEWWPATGYVVVSKYDPTGNVTGV